MLLIIMIRQKQEENESGDAEGNEKAAALIRFLLGGSAVENRGQYFIQKNTESVQQYRTWGARRAPEVTTNQ